MRPYESIEAWRAAHLLFLRVHRLTESWPKREWYGLAAQVRRSSFSVAANIVEGHAKRGRKEFRRYLDIAWGSYCETRYALHAATELALISSGDAIELEPLVDDPARMLWGLMRFLAVDGFFLLNLDP